MESSSQNKWIVLLTTCLNPQNQSHNNRHEIRFRKDLYTSIKKIVKRN